MKIVIPSKGRDKTISTHLLFKDTEYKYTLVLHNEEEKARYLQNPTIDPSTIVLSHQPYQMSLQRQWILDHVVSKNEWFLTLDDNVKGFVGFPEPFYSTVPEYPQPKTNNMKHRKFSETPVDIHRFIKICEEMIQHCEKEKVYYAGFATNMNYFFRCKKYSYVGYVISKVALIKNVGVSYDPAIAAMTDYGFSAAHLRRYGKVLINKYIFPLAGHYEPGGIGTYPERLERKIFACQYLMKKYPGLFGYMKKKTADSRAELRFRFHSIDQIAVWNRMLDKMILDKPL